MKLSRLFVYPVKSLAGIELTEAEVDEFGIVNDRRWMVVDEHGSVTGLVTMEDLLEEIVGEIEDEYDWEERPVEKLRDGSLVVDGTTTAAELRDVHHIPLPASEEFDTVAGFMLNSLGALPRGGEVVGVGDYRLTVVDVEKNRIAKVKIEKTPAVVKA